MNDQSRLLSIACLLGALVLGGAAMVWAGAPLRFPLMNGAALLIALAGSAVWVRSGLALPAGLLPLAAALGLLATAGFGVEANGVTRWAVVAGLVIQPSLVLLPALAVAAIRTPSRLGGAALVVAAAALAWQPDRAMAGALLAGLAAACLVGEGPMRRALALPLGTAALAFGIALLRPDPSPAVPFVDRWFADAFAFHPLAGLMVAGGAALLLVPAIRGVAADLDRRPLHAAAGALWAAIIAGALLGNHPTPVVGYGGSAVLGYLLTILALDRRSGRAAAGEAAGTSGGEDEPGARLRLMTP